MTDSRHALQTMSDHIDALLVERDALHDEVIELRPLAKIGLHAAQDVTDEEPAVVVARLRKERDELKQALEHIYDNIGYPPDYKI